jgi:acetyltransferase-like isoleucine patch superfamily enzyme
MPTNERAEVRARRRLASIVHRLGSRVVARLDPPLPMDLSKPHPPFDGFGNVRWYEAGVGTYGTPAVHVYFGDTNRVIVGNYSSLADGVEFMVGANHTIDSVTSWPVLECFALPGAWELMPWSKGDIIVGNDVWIGRGAKILSGVTIGDGAVIGAYSVVTRNVRPFAIVAGNPAVEHRRRFEDHIVNRLLAIRWWDWPLDVARERAKALASRDVVSFVEAFHDSVPPPQ